MEADRKPGGETAEHPGLLGPDEYDVAGSTTGVVEATHLLGPGRVRPGDVVVAMRSSGLHSNGYSLVRHVLLEQAGWALDRDVPELGRTLGIERIMVRDRTARITFRPGVVPRLTTLESPLRDRQVEVEVRRMTPLSLELRQVGPLPLTGTLVKALALLLESRAAA